MTKIKENDFIELSYTGKTKEEDVVFDTTDQAVAKEHNLEPDNREIKPVIVCLGHGQLIKGLDAQLIGKETEKPYTIEVAATEAYGKKDAKLIQLISTAKFTKQQVQPMPGLTINIDGMMGVIKTVSGGRTLVDFNHPLAGKDLVYEVTINQLITDDKLKINATLKANLGVEDEKLMIENGKATITLPQKLPKEFEEKIGEEIKKIVPSIKTITIQEEQKKEESLNTSKPSTENKE